MSLLFKLVDVLTAIGFISGIVGRGITFRRATQAEEAVVQGKVTPELTAALADKGVVRYRAIELVVVILITILMVTKPF